MNEGEQQDPSEGSLQVWSHIVTESNGESIMKGFQMRWTNLQNLIIGVMTMGITHKAFAQLSEVENTVLWVEDIFSPVLLLSALIILCIGCGLAFMFGRMSGGLFVRILGGSILIFGARTIAAKLSGVVA